jgi:hypothetical protein
MNEWGLTFAMASQIRTSTTVQLDALDREWNGRSSDTAMAIRRGIRRELEARGI